MIPHLRSLLAAATPGKWRLGDESDLLSGLTASARARDLRALCRRIYCDGESGLRTVALASRHAEAALIAAAVSALPALIEVAERAGVAATAIDEAIVLVDEGRSGTHAIEKSGLNDVLSDLRAALAKLEGE